MVGVSSTDNLIPDIQASFFQVSIALTPKSIDPFKSTMPRVAHNTATVIWPMAKAAAE